MTTTPSSKSIHELTPIETGGVIARNGFIFQDHVAVSFCIEMIIDPSLKQVWCETQDDITLIWECNGYEKVEFIQVKNSQFNQLWTIVKLCEPDHSLKSQGINSNSILEKSLAYDRCKEPCCFRIITSRDINKTLKILTYPIDHPQRNTNNAEYLELIKQIGERNINFISDNGNNYEFWAKNTLWDVIHTDELIKQRNIIKLSKHIFSLGIFFSPDQIEDKIYNRILKKIQDAANADSKKFPQNKKILKNDFISWLNNIIKEERIGFSVGGRKLQHKMQYASLSSETIETAHELRRNYRNQNLSSKYLDPVDRDFIENEVISLLQKLRSELDSGEIIESGVQFHQRCLKELSNLQNNLPIHQKPPISFLYGLMYNIADRCLHRFQKSENQS